MRKTVWVIACSALLLFCSWCAAAEQLEITKPAANMRVEPNNKADVVGSIPKGAIVPVIDRYESWCKVEYNGKEGWIFSKLANQRANAGEIFTKQDVSMLPPVPVGDDSADAEAADAKPSQKYAQVIKDNTLIRYYLDPQAPYLYKARKGDWFELIGEGDSWCKVACNKSTPGNDCNDASGKDTSGWVKKTDVEILDTKPTKATIVVEEAKTLFFGLLALGIVILIVSIIITFRHLKAERMRNVYVQKNALILAKESKHVQYMLTNATETMERCFSEIGFNVIVTKDSVTARNIIESSMPDLILVDWNFETAIFAKIDNLFARLALQTMPHFLFYNVPDPTAVPPCKALRNVNLLGISVVDRDIFKVVTPLLVHKTESESADIQKGVQRCALEGEIAGGNLLEVLQFIEIGSKTGCLMVETRGPFGLVYFGDGRITYAAAKGPDGGPIYGVEAVYEILNQPMGKFRFITNKQPKVANLNLPTLSVLMEWTKEKDESHKR
jgi:uncharacterized protein YraI